MLQTKAKVSAIAATNDAIENAANRLADLNSIFNADSDRDACNTQMIQELEIIAKALAVLMTLEKYS